MKFTIDAKQLVAALRKVKGATEKRQPMPILASVVIEARNDSQIVTFSATDLELAISATDFRVLVQAAGSAVVPLDKLLSLARKLKGRVEIKLAADNYVTVSCEKIGSKITLAGHPRDEYPVLPGAPENAVTVEARPLRTALKTVIHAASSDDTRYHLNGIYIDADSEPTVRMVATDGHRLAIADAGPMSLPWEGGIIVPVKGAENLIKLVKGEASVTVAKGESYNLHVSGDTWSIQIRLIEGEFPNYQQVIPKEITETVVVDRDTFESSVSTALELSAERSRAVKMVLNGGMELHSSNPDLGDSVVNCPIEPRLGVDERDDMELAFNGRYLIDALKTVNGEKVLIGIKDPTSPVRISGVDPFPFAMVMPMRV